MRFHHGRLLLATLVLLGPAGSAQAGEDALLARLAGVLAGDAAVRLPADGTLSLLTSGLEVPAQARLHLARVSPLGNGRRLLRFECEFRRQCLPFEVVLDVPGRRDDELVQPDTRGSAVPPPRRCPPLAPVVRPGQRVQLMEESSGLRLTVPVVCLQPGALGQKIRVRNLATRRVVVARVLDKDQVRVEE
jgi:hypothetical protein